MYGPGSASHLVPLLRECYGATPEADSTLLAMINLRQVQAEHVAEDCSSPDLLMMLPGLSGGARSDVLASAHGMTIDLQVPQLHSAREMLSEAADEIRAANLSGKEAAQLLSAASDCEKGEAREEQIVEAWQLFQAHVRPRLQLQGERQDLILSTDELVALYDFHAASVRPAAVAFREAVDREDYAQASRLANQLSNGDA